MPVLFVGHGSPMNAIEDNQWSRGFRALGESLPRPRAILAISAHWYVPGTYVTSNDHPETIHDFGGFPQELYAVHYPAPGSLSLAARVSRLIASVPCTGSSEWGLDHGTWSVLRSVRPQADFPVVQLSIDHRLPPEGHWRIGRELAPLREEGVLIMGSGNVTHNLGHVMRSIYEGRKSTPAWARDFDADVARALEQHDGDYLLRALESDAGRSSHPTPDHWLPILYAAGASTADDAVSFPIAGFEAGSLSMRAVRLG